MTRYQPIHSRVRQARPTKGAISAITTSISVKGCLVTEGRGAMARSSLLEINASNKRHDGHMVASEWATLSALEPDAGAGVFPM